MPEKLGTALGSQISSVLPPKLECVVARKATWNFDLSSLSRTTRILVCAVLVLAPACQGPWEKQRSATGIGGRGKRDRERKLRFDEPAMVLDTKLHSCSGCQTNRGAWRLVCTQSITALPVPSENALYVPVWLRLSCVLVHCVCYNTVGAKTAWQA